MIAAALAYAEERGWPIFPVKFDKAPFTPQGVLDATTDVRQITEWWDRWPKANIALDVGGAGMMVLDLDPGHDMKELEDNVGPIPDTGLRADTPRGGRHLYYELGKDEVVAASASKLAPHVDVRSFHSYVLLPPSRTKDGTYTWEGEDHQAYRTDEMVRVANSARQKHKDRDTWLIEADLPDNVTLATAWLRNKAKPAIEGQGGDHCAYATAGMMKSYGISPELAFDLMWEHWNPRCDPPWSGDEVDHLQQKVEHAYSYNTSPPGNMTPAYKTARAKTMFQSKPRLAWNDGECVDWEDWNPPSEKELAELEREREKALDPPSLIEHMQAALGGNVGSLPAIPLYDLDEMASLPAPEWDMEGLIRRAKMGMIVGKWGHYKTFLALDMAVALAGQLPWPAVADKGCKQYAVPKARRVLYIAAEGGAAEYHQRLEAALGNRWEIDRDQVKRNFVLATASAPLDRTAGQKAIADVIERATEKMGGPPEVIFCDTLAKSMAGEENSNTDMGKVQGVAAAIQHTLECSFIFVHHTGKDGEKSGRGASSMPAGLDFQLHVTGDEATKVATVNVEKQKDDPFEKNIILQGRVVNNSLVFARIAKAPSKKADQEITGLMHRLGQIIEDGGGGAISTQGLAKQLAREADDSFESRGADKRKGQIEKMRGWIRRNIIEAKSPGAKDFREQYLAGTGRNTHWVHKDAVSE